MATSLTSLSRWRENQDENLSIFSVGKFGYEFSDDLRHISPLRICIRLQSVLKLFGQSNSKGKTFVRHCCYFVATIMMSCSSIVAMIKAFRWADCTYCGDSATSVDHVVPLTYASPTGNRKGVNPDIRKKAVPCCCECNSLLGSKSYFTISERAEFLSQRLAVRHRKLLALPIWSDEEIDLLRGNLRQNVKANQKKRLVVIERIRHCLFVAGLPDLSIDQVWSSYNKGLTISEWLTGENQKAVGVES